MPYSVHSILRCRHADQILPMLPAPQATSGKPALQCPSNTPMQVYELQMKSLLLNILLELLNHWRWSIYRVSQEGRSIFWEIIVSVFLSKNVYMNMCPIPNGFRDRAIWMYNRKIVDRKDILHVRTVSKTGIYCSSDRVGTVYDKCSKIPPSTSMPFATRVKTLCVVRLSGSWRSFMQAITSSMLTSSSSRVSTFFLYTSLFIKPHKQKSNWVKSGDLGGQLMVLPRPIYLLRKVSLRCCITCRV